MHKTTIHSVLLVASVVASVVLFVLAAHAYPGGTHFDHHVTGHDFWLNTLCDVARGTALSGARNEVGSVLARTAMTIFVIGVGGALSLVPDISPMWPGRRRLVRALAWTSVTGAIAVVHLPTDRYSGLHAVAIVLAGIPGLVAATLAMLSLLRRPAAHPVAAVLGACFLAASAADFGIYVHEVVTGGAPRVLLPILERIATLTVLAWMLAVARAASCNSRTSTTVHSPAC